MLHYCTIRLCYYYVFLITSFVRTRAVSVLRSKLLQACEINKSGETCLRELNAICYDCVRKSVTEKTLFSEFLPIWLHTFLFRLQNPFLFLNVRRFFRNGFFKSGVRFTKIQNG